MGGCFSDESELFACFLGESGIFRVYSGKKWTCLHAFLEQVDFFACSLHVGDMHVPKIMKNVIENYAFIDIMI